MRARSSALRTPRRTRRCASCMAVSVREAAFRYEPAPLFKVAKGARRGNRKGGRGRPARLAPPARSARPEPAGIGSSAGRSIEHPGPSHSPRGDRPMKKALFGLAVLVLVAVPAPVGARDKGKRPPGGADKKGAERAYFGEPKYGGFTPYGGGTSVQVTLGPGAAG